MQSCSDAETLLYFAQAEVRQFDGKYINGDTGIPACEFNKGIVLSVAIVHCFLYYCLDDMLCRILGL